EAARTTRIIEAEFGRNHHVLAGRAVFHPLPDCGLALAPLTTRQPGRVEVAGVDECPALLAEQIQQPERRLAIDFAADRICPHTDSADRDSRVCQLNRLHKSKLQSQADNSHCLVANMTPPIMTR